jgi:hypothetical protein
LPASSATSRDQGSGLDGLGEIPLVAGGQCELAVVGIA